MKVLEAFSVMRLNDANFTTTLKRKLSSTQSDSSSVSNGNSERKRSDSVCSSTSSESAQISSLENLPAGCRPPSSPGMLGEGIQNPPEERRYSSSFHDIHAVESLKEPWNAECPPYSSQHSRGEPPPYSEKPSDGSLSLSIDSSVTTDNASSQHNKHKQTSMLHKLRLRKMRNVFSPSASHGSDHGGGSGGKLSKSPGEKRRFFGGIKRFNTSGGQPDSDLNSSDSSETRI